MGAINVTPFGKELRKLRIDKGEVLINMADKLGITAAYLSSIENGKREIPEDFMNKLADAYNLSKEQEHSLEYSIIETKKKVTMNIPDSSKEDEDFIETALLFARDLSKLNKKQIRKVKDILSSFNNDGEE